MKRLGDIHFAELLPDSIRHDPTVAASAETLNSLLRKTTLSIPNLLIWARLERDSATLIPPLARLAAAAGGLKAHSLDTLELLAWQLHVDFRDVATDEAMLERMVRESIPWHRLKGTPAAVERALAMYGIEALVDECGRGQNWAVYELELAEAPDLRNISKIVRLADEAAPVRCRLRRLHDDYNLQPIIWGEGPPLGEGYWGDDSGVWDEESGLKLSFREKTGLLGESFFGDLHARTVMAAMMGALIHWPGRPIWGRWRFGDKLTDLKRSWRRDLQAALSESLEFQRHRWSGPWDGRRWERPATVLLNRRLDRFLNFSKSAFIWGESRFGSPLQQLSGRGHLSDARRIIWGEFRYGDSNKDYEPVYIKLHELFIERSVLGGSALQPQDLKQFGRERRAVLIEAGDRPRLGRWRFGGKSPVPRRGARHDALTVLSESIELDRHHWPGSWDRRRWGRSESPRRDRHLNFCTSNHLLTIERTEKIYTPISHCQQARPGHIQWPGGGLGPSRWQGPWRGRWRPPVYMKITNIGV